MLTYTLRWATTPLPRLSCGSKVGTSGTLIGEIEKFLGVLHDLGAGKNTRISIKDMLSEDEFSWATHAPC